MHQRYSNLNVTSLSNKRLNSVLKQATLNYMDEKRIQYNTQNVCGYNEPAFVECPHCYFFIYLNISGLLVSALCAKVDKS